MDDEGKVSLDLLGFLCPVPVHETRRAVEDANPGTLFEVLCDDPETLHDICLLYTSPSPRDLSTSRMPSSA